MNRLRRDAVAVALVLIASLFTGGCAGASAGEGNEAGMESAERQSSGLAGKIPDESATAASSEAAGSPSPSSPDADDTDDADDAARRDNSALGQADEEGDLVGNIALIVAGQSFDLQLADNETARAFAARLPLELSMDELNGNEKYCYLDAPLPSSAEAVGRVEVGDVMLYDDSCVVVFYESHATDYRYTRIGTVKDPGALAEAVGSGSTSVRFE